MEFLKSEFIDVNLENVEGIPIYVVSPKIKCDKYKTIIFYHGWGSSAKNQIFRANIFASYGYQVILPEARYHGQRGNLDYDDKDILKAKLNEIIMHNIEEFPTIYRYIVNELKADEENIAVGGHSMGAMTSAGLFTFKKSLKVAMLFNGVSDWKWLVDLSNDEKQSYETMRINEFMLQMNPKEHLENLVDRELIIYNGAEDKSVNPEVQEEFYNLARKAYTDESKIRFIKWEATGHQLTTQMLDRAIMSLKEEIGF